MAKIFSPLPPGTLLQNASPQRKKVHFQKFRTNLVTTDLKKKNCAEQLKEEMHFAFSLSLYRYKEFSGYSPIMAAVTARAACNSECACWAGRASRRIAHVFWEREELGLFRRRRCHSRYLLTRPMRRLVRSQDLRSLRQRYFRATSPSFADIIVARSSSSSSLPSSES